MKIVVHISIKYFSGKILHDYWTIYGAHKTSYCFTDRTCMYFLLLYFISVTRTKGRLTFISILICFLYEHGNNTTSQQDATWCMSCFDKNWINFINRSMDPMISFTVKRRGIFESAPPCASYDHSSPLYILWITFSRTHFFEFIHIQINISHQNDNCCMTSCDNNARIERECLK